MWTSQRRPDPFPSPAPLIKPFNACHLHQQHNKLVWSSGMTFASHLLSFSTKIGRQRWNATGPRFDPWYEHLFASPSTFSEKGWMCMIFFASFCCAGVSGVGRC